MENHCQTCRVFSVQYVHNAQHWTQPIHRATIRIEVNAMETIKRVFLYIRVSTESQEEGYSIDEQKDRLLAYCKAHGWIVVAIFIDPGHSGSNLNRPAMQTMIEAAERRDADAVLVYKLDRLSRSQKDTLYLIEDVFMPNGVDFISMQENINTASVFGKAMIGVLSVFAQLEREQITERTMMGRDGRAKEGKWHGGGTEPIGYDYVNGVLEVPTFKSTHSQLNLGYSLVMKIPGTSPISPKICAPLHIPKTGFSSFTNALIPSMTGVIEAIAPALK